MNNKLAPGSYTARMISASQDPTGNFIHACLEAMVKDGTVLVHHTWQFDTVPKLKLKMHSIEDLFCMPKGHYTKRSLRDKHHKRKSQPNRGPVGRNQW